MGGEPYKEEGGIWILTLLSPSLWYEYIPVGFPPWFSQSSQESIGRCPNPAFSRPGGLEVYRYIGSYPPARFPR